LNGIRHLVAKKTGGRWSHCAWGEDNPFCRKKTIKKRKNATKRNGGIATVGVNFSNNNGRAAAGMRYPAGGRPRR